MSTYYLHALVDNSNLSTAPYLVAGWTAASGFVYNSNGFGSVEPMAILSQIDDDSWMFIGGAFATPGGGLFNRAGFTLQYDLDQIYEPPPTGPVGIGEPDPALVAVPPIPHSWTVTIRWRVPAGTPPDRGPSEPALSILVPYLGGGATTLIRTWADASTDWITEDIEIPNSGVAAETSDQFGYALRVRGTVQQEELSPSESEYGPNYTPTQIAWITVTGPNFTLAATAGGARAVAGTRRGHFS